MTMKTEYFSAGLVAHLNSTDSYLPVSPEAEADLLKLLGDGDFILLALKGEIEYEVVKATNRYGTLVLERGLGGTTPVLHHIGTCVISASPLVVEVLKELICSYDCCADGDCPCTPVTYAGGAAPRGVVGEPWEGSAAFAGDSPMALGVNGAPGWMQVELMGSALRLYGVPDVAGTTSFSAAASNCNGTAVASGALTVIITEQ